MNGYDLQSSVSILNLSLNKNFCKAKQIREISIWIHVGYTITDHTWTCMGATLHTFRILAGEFEAILEDFCEKFF
jgi:hypothetical protein